MEVVVLEYLGVGVVCEFFGLMIIGIVLMNMYECKDGKYVIIGGNGELIFQCLMMVVGCFDMVEDLKFVGNENCVVYECEIDEVFDVWCLILIMDEVFDMFVDVEVLFGFIYSVCEMMDDLQYQVCEFFEEVEFQGELLQIFVILLCFIGMFGCIEWFGFEFGVYNQEIYGDFLGLGVDEFV